MNLYRKKKKKKSMAVETFGDILNTKFKKGVSNSMFNIPTVVEVLGLATGSDFYLRISASLKPLMFSRGIVRGLPRFLGLFRSEAESLSEPEYLLFRLRLPSLPLKLIYNPVNHYNNTSALLQRFGLTSF